jgi:preprotein translocase subunit SecG
MQNVVLTIHLIIALLLIGAVLLQRSEGGALGMGGGGGGGGVMSGRSAATALQKATWALTVAFIATSLTLTVIATQTARDEGLLDRATTSEQPVSEGGDAPGLPEGLMPNLPNLGGDDTPTPAPNQ